MKETIIIANVDVNLLEKQRVGLANIIEAIELEGIKVDPKDLEAAIGIKNMLNNWSDKRYFDGAHEPKIIKSIQRAAQYLLADFEDVHKELEQTLNYLKPEQK